VTVARLLSLLIGALLATGCGGTGERCASEASCPAGTVCEASGACRPLALDPVVRVARARWLLPLAARIAPATANAGDAIRLGGDSSAVLYLSFAALPNGADDATAALVLTPHATFAHPLAPMTLIVDRVRTPGTSGTPQAIQRVAGSRALGADSRGVVRVDLSELIRDASRAGVRTLDLAVRAEGEGALRIASPASLERRHRPRLEVLVP
jgi:hypothetical protein